MRKIFIVLGCLFSIQSALFSQTIPESLTGKWVGTLNAGIELRIVFNIDMNNDTLITTIDSPDQGANGIKTESTTYKNAVLKVNIPLIGGGFEGTYIEDSMRIRGNWMQSGQVIPLVLNKTDEVNFSKKLQDPVKPYPYREEKIVFNNTVDNVTLAGTLTIPPGKGPFNTVILITGSGPQNRDEFLLGHSPFWVLSDFLTRQGNIVLRYDDRGVGESTGDFQTATSENFARDANAAVEYLVSRKDLPIGKIGFAGHSEGGMIAPMAALKNAHVDFIVLLAGPGIPGDSILNLQGDLIARANGMSEDIVNYNNQLRRAIINAAKQEGDVSEMRSNIIAATTHFLETTPADMLVKMGLTKADSTLAVDFYASKWMQYFLTYDPVPALEKLKIPVLALNGTHDLQVPYKDNLQGIETALEAGKNKNYKIVEMPGLNHLFQTSESGSPSEYATNKETFNEEAMHIIADWIRKLK